jgi:hypothetical protein
MPIGLVLVVLLQPKAQSSRHHSHHRVNPWIVGGIALKDIDADDRFFNFRGFSRERSINDILEEGGGANDGLAKIRANSARTVSAES